MLYITYYIYTRTPTHSVGIEPTGQNPTKTIHTRIQRRKVLYYYYIQLYT